MPRWEWGPEELASDWEREMEFLYHAYKCDHPDGMTYGEFVEAEFEKMRNEIADFHDELNTGRKICP